MFIETLSISGVLLVVIGIVLMIQKIGREFFLITGIILGLLTIIVGYNFGISNFTTALGIVGIVSFLIGGGEKLLKS